MNKNLYRLVFSEARGMLVAVAERVVGRGKSAAGGLPRPPAVVVSLRPLSFALWLALGLVHSASAQVVAYRHAPAGQQPVVLSAGNGVPLVNIQTPSAAGVSRNSYEQFDVQAQGAILNNSRTDVQTQLGGWVQGNPWLAGGTARVILNEVISAHPSQLLGYVEVAGSRAQVVIANPAGVTCNGCGFINASRATLTTGTPVISGGNLDGYRVVGGSIRVEGAGLDDSRSDYTELIARAIEVNAGIWAQNLRVTAGSNQVSVDHAVVTPIAGSGPAPTFAIDTGVLGGMYAGKITLVGSEAGVGVRNAGEIGAAAGDVSISVDGQLSNSGTLLAGRRLSIDAAGLGSSGGLLSLGELSVVLSGDFVHSGEVLASDRIDLQVGGLLDNRATIAAGNRLDVTAGDINNASGGSISARQTSLSASQTLNNRGLIDGVDTLIRATRLNHLGGGRIYGDRLAIAATTLDNHAEGGSAPVIAARDRLDIGVQRLSNRDHALLFSSGDLAIGGALDSNQRASGRAETVGNASATIEALGKLALAAGEIHNSNEDFTTTVVDLGSEDIVEYQGSGAPERYTPGTAGVYIYNDESDHLMTPERSYESWLAYDYRRQSSETRVLSSDPGQILAGGAMLLSADSLVNDKSHIVAGGAIVGTLGSLVNTDAMGERTIIESGTVTSYWRDRQKGRDRTGSSSTAYTPPVTIQSISLAPTRYEQNSLPAGSGTQVSVLAAPGGLLAVPDNALFRANPAPTAAYLIESDPRLSNYRQWLGSDYLLAQLAMDPALTQKRLGDGFYEQKLIREQLAQLTGRRFIEGYGDDEAQYLALMNNAVTAAAAFDLRPGIALSDAQVAALTSDIVWLVEREVKLADGSLERVLVPQLYVRARPDDLVANGALIGGAKLQLEVAGELRNGGTLAGRQLVALTAENLSNVGGSIEGATVGLQARNDLVNVGGKIRAQESLSVLAGRDVSLVSSMSQQENAQGSQRQLDRVAGLYVGGSTGSLLVSAGRDLSVGAAEVKSEGSATLQAGRDLSLVTQEENRQQQLVWDGANHRRDATRTEIGSVLSSQGELTLIAGQDLIARAAGVSSEQGRIEVVAGRDLVIEAGQANVTVDESHQHKSKGFLSSRTTSTGDSLDSTTAVASTFSGETVTLAAKRDLQVTGSNVVATGDTTLVAGRDLSIEAATETHAETHVTQTKKSGIFSSGSFGITIGSMQNSTDQQLASTTAAKSTVGSVEGKVTLLAGENYRQVGSDVIAVQGDIDIGAKTVDLVEARASNQNTIEQKSKQSGLTIAISSPVISAIQTAQQMSQAAKDTKDGRMQALAAASTGLAAYNAAQALKSGQGETIDDKAKQIAIKDDAGNVIGSRDATTAEQLGGVSLVLSLGASKSSSQTTQTSDSAAVSKLTAGRDITITARGAGEASDITLQGVQANATSKLTLAAEDEIKLLAAHNTADQTSSNQNASGSIGISLGTNTGITVGASVGRGKADGDDLSHTNTRLQAGETLTLQSGGDTTLRGAVAKAEQVVAEIGGDLNIESLQDTSTFDSKQKSLGGSITFGAGLSGSVSASSSKINSDYASVVEQSGIRAGDGGFQVNVQGDTDLKGAAITSTQKAIDDNKNRLRTATLTTSNIANHASASASSSGFNLSSDMLTQGKYGLAKGVVGNALNNANESGSSSGQTRAVISSGTVEITDEVRQLALAGKTVEQTLDSLNRDEASAHAAVQRIDHEVMRRQVEAERAIKEQTVKMVSVFTDEAYRSRFLQKPQVLKGECPAGGNCNADPSKIIYSRVNEDEIRNADPGSVLAVNGILNDERRAVELGYQNIVPDEITGNKPTTFYVMHVAPANNAFSELLGVAYEKIVASADYELANFLGYTNGQALYADLLRSRGQQEIVSLGHSRGTLIQEAAFTILANRPGEDGILYSNPNLTVRGVGGAADAVVYSEKAAVAQGPQGDPNNITYSYFSNDPVSVSSFSGGNPGVWTLKDLWQVFATDSSMHSCYGTGAKGCSQVEIPVPSGPPGTPDGNAKLIEYVGGQRKGSIQTGGQL